MRSTVMLAYIRLVYDVEHEAQECQLRGEARRALRQEKSKAILGDIRTYLKREQPHVLPKSPEGQEMAYTLANWKALTRYVDDGDLAIDNNAAEHSLRGVAVGRKNWMFTAAITVAAPPPCSAALSRPRSASA
jgi:transposase